MVYEYAEDEVVVSTLWLDDLKTLKGKGKEHKSRQIEQKQIEEGVIEEYEIGT